MTMIERIAMVVWDGVGGISETDALRVAKAVVKAMREPTSEMIEAVRANGGGTGVMYAHATWPGMIDAILTEDEK